MMPGANNRPVPDEQPENLDPVPPPSGLASAFARPTISTHPPCVKCGYDLQGLLLDGVCPECGEAVRSSLSIETLGHLPPEQLKALRRGAACVQWGVVVFGVSVPLAFMRSEATPTGSGWIVVILLVAAHVGSVVLSAIGWWMLTQPRGPWWTGAVAKRGGHIRVLTMVVVVADSLRGVMLLMGEGTFPIGVFRIIQGGNPWDIANMAAFFVAGLAALARLYLSTSLILDYAKRMPSMQLAKQARNARVAVPIVGILGAALCGLGPVIAWALYLGLIDNFRWSLKLVAWRKGGAG
jgi:hypothetical protein